MAWKLFRHFREDVWPTMKIDVKEIMRQWYNGCIFEHDHPVWARNAQGDLLLKCPRCFYSHPAIPGVARGAVTPNAYLVPNDRPLTPKKSQKRGRK